MMLTETVARAMGIEVRRCLSTVSTSLKDSMHTTGRSLLEAHIVLAPDSHAELELREGLPTWHIAPDNASYQVLLGVQAFVHAMAGLYPCFNQLTYWPRGYVHRDLQQPYVLPVLGLVTLPRRAIEAAAVRAEGLRTPHTGPRASWPQLLEQAEAMVASVPVVNEAVITVHGQRYSLAAVVEGLSDDTAPLAPNWFAPGSDGFRNLFAYAPAHLKVQLPSPPSHYVAALTEGAPVTYESLRLAAVLVRMWEDLIMRTHRPMQVGLLRLMQTRWAPPAEARARRTQLAVGEPEPGVFPVPDFSQPPVAAHDPYGVLALAASYSPLPPTEKDQVRIARHQAVGDYLRELAVAAYDHVASILEATPPAATLEGQPPEGLQNPAAGPSTPATSSGSGYSHLVRRARSGAGKGKNKNKSKR
jgi:hypothetical protein